MSEPGIVVADEWESSTETPEQPTQRWRLTDSGDSFEGWFMDGGEWRLMYPCYEMVPSAFVSALVQRIAQLKNGGGK